MKRAHVETATELVIAVLLGLMIAWALSSCEGVRAGDLIPDRWDFHLYRSKSDGSHPRPILDGQDSDSWTIGTTIGFDLTETDHVDIRPLVERLAAIEVNTAAAVAAHKVEPPPEDDGSLEAWVLGSGGLALLAGLGEMMRRARPAQVSRDS